MNNNELVLKIIDTIDIYKIIDNCGVKTGKDDLLQYIYLVLLEYENLEMVYEGGYILPFIIRIILNQRNGSHTIYNKSFKLYDIENELVDDIDSDDSSYIINNTLMDYLNMEMSLYGNDVEYVLKKCIVIMIRTGKSIRTISSEMGISKSLLSLYIRELKSSLWTKLYILYIYIKEIENGMKEHEFVKYWRSNILGKKWNVDELDRAYYILEGRYPDSKCVSCIRDRLIYLQNKFGIMIRIPSIMDKVRELEDMEVEKRNKRKKSYEVRTISEGKES